MEFNYDIDKGCSLRTMTMVTVARGVLESSGLVPHFKTGVAAVASEASRKADQLDLPTVLKHDIKAILRPIMMEIWEWYLRYTYGARPVLTVYGTLDVTKSILALRNTVDADTILDRYRGYLSDSWWKNYTDEIEATNHYTCLTEQTCASGLTYAVNTNNSAAIKLVSERASRDTIYYIASRFLSRNYCCIIHPPPLEFLPSTYFSLFSRLDKYQQMTLQARFSVNMLTALLKWPYQHLFLKAAKTLTVNLSDDAHCDIARKILAKMLYGYKDHDYRTLFIEFWALSGCRRQSHYLFTSKGRKLLSLVHLMQDKRITALVLHGTSEKGLCRLLEEARVSDFCEAFKRSKKLEKLWQYSAIFQKCLSECKE